MGMPKVALCILVLSLPLAAPLALGADGPQTCVDSAVSQCFDTCTNPLNFQECIIGCATGANNLMRNCTEQCYGDETCLSHCQSVIQAIANCPYVSGIVTVACGAVVMNRATGNWQQTVRITNTSQTDTITKAAYVLESLALGWTLVNGDGVTSDIVPAGRPYKDIGPLAPGSTTPLTLQFRRTGTPIFGYTTRVIWSETR